MVVTYSGQWLVDELVAGRREPPAEVHVLPKSKAGVEAARSFKSDAPYRQAGTDQVGDRAPRTSFGIVGAEVKRRADGLVAFEPAPLAGPQDTAAGSRDRGVGELGDQSPQPVGIRPAVAVEEGEKVAPTAP